MSKNFLRDIVEYKRTVIRNDKRAEPPAALRKRIKELPAPKKLSAALGKGGGVIAEIKRRSPGVKKFPHTADILELAREYERNGASAISVLTDEKFFGGSVADLARAGSGVDLPVLRKDFIIDEYQVRQARAYGADAVLLIASILDGGRLMKLYEAGRALGLEALVEVHDRAELAAVAGLFRRKKGVILGINNRNLRTLEVDLSAALRLLRFAPAGMTKVVESGIRSRRGMEKYRRLGADGFLIGATLLKAPSPGKRLRQLIYGKSQDMRHHQLPRRG